MMAVIGVGINDLLPGSPWFALHLQEGPVFTSNIDRLALGQSARLRFGPKPITKFTLRHPPPTTTQTFQTVLGLVGD